MKIILATICAICISVMVQAQEPNWKLGVSVGVTQPNLDSFFKYAKDAGIDYLEVGLPAYKKTDLATAVKLVADYKSKADAAGLTIWSVHIPFGWDYDISEVDPVKREACKQYIMVQFELAKGLGSYKKAIIHPSFEPNAPESRAAKVAALREVLIEIGPIVEKEYGCRIAVEDLPRTCIGNSSKEMLQIVEGIESVDVCFDVNHLLGEKSEVFARNVGSRIKTLHISDYDEINERHWLPGKGVINWNGVIGALVAANYDGPFMFEVTKTPWGDDMQKFCNDLAGSWKMLKENYLKSIGKLKKD